MIPTLYKITPAVNLRAIQTDRFKNAQLSVSLILPADSELSPLTTLLFSVLRRGTEQYPTIKELNYVLDMLYGATLSYRNTFFGDFNVICLVSVIAKIVFKLNVSDHNNVVVVIVNSHISTWPVCRTAPAPKITFVGTQ